MDTILKAVTESKSLGMALLILLVGLMGFILKSLSKKDQQFQEQLQKSDNRYDRLSEKIDEEREEFRKERRDERDSFSCKIDTMQKEHKEELSSLTKTCIQTIEKNTQQLEKLQTVVERRSL